MNWEGLAFQAVDGLASASGLFFVAAGLSLIFGVTRQFRHDHRKNRHRETAEERRAAMIAKGWSPTVLAALEEAMEPKFLRDMREEDEGQGEAEH
jgi:hypothetical protein